VIANTYRQLRKHPDIIHVNTCGSVGSIRDILVLYLAKWFRVPSIMHYHLQRTPAEVPHHGILWRLLLWGMSLADTVVLLDKRSEECIRAIFPNKHIVVLPNMIEMDVIDDLAKQVAPREMDGVTRVVFVGYLKPVKGIRELVAACAKLGNRRFELNMVGMFFEYQLQSELETLASKSPQTGWLHFLGNKDDPKDVLKEILASDIHVLPSHAESAPFSVLEGMACGKPVVSTFTGAVPEMLDIGGPEECGICVPVKDVDALAEALARLIDHPEERVVLGQKAQQRIRDHYAASPCCNMLLELWQSLKRDAPKNGVQGEQR
jgi:glycosyltransferase involved in cell wall biosynthesis